MGNDDTWLVMYIEGKVHVRQEVREWFHGFDEGNPFPFWAPFSGFDPAGADEDGDKKVIRSEGVCDPPSNGSRRAAPKQAESLVDAVVFIDKGNVVLLCKNVLLVEVGRRVYTVSTSVLGIGFFQRSGLLCLSPGKSRRAV